MLIKIFVLGPIDNNTFLVGCEKTKNFFVIDPSFDAFNEIKKFLKDSPYSLNKICLTHAHWDHIADVKLLKDAFSIPVYIHEKDAKMLKNPMDLFSLKEKIQGVDADVLLKDNDKITVGALEIEIIHTPGHTPGCACYLIKKEKTLFSGDTLFKNSFGRVDFEYSNPQDMIKSLKKLSKLDKDIKVYPGHGSITSIGDESWMENADKFI